MNGPATATAAETSAGLSKKPNSLRPSTATTVQALMIARSRRKAVAGR